MKYLVFTFLSFLSLSAFAGAKQSQVPNCFIETSQTKAGHFVFGYNSDQFGAELMQDLAISSLQVTSQTNYNRQIYTISKIDPAAGNASQLKTETLAYLTNLLKNREISFITCGGKFFVPHRPGQP